MNRIADKYPRLVENFKPVFDETIDLHYSIYDQFFWSNLKKNSIVLDLGCGVCPFWGVSNIQSFRALGLDSAYNLIRQGNTQSTPVQKICADAHEIPLKSNSVDGVAAVWFIEHIKNPHIFFAELSRILKPGGIAFIVTPNLKNPLNYTFLLLPPGIRNFIAAILAGHPEDYKTYCRANTINKIGQLCSQEKLKIIKIQYVYNTKIFEILPYGPGLYKTIIKMSDDNPLKQYAGILYLLLKKKDTKV